MHFVPKVGFLQSEIVFSDQDVGSRGLKIVQGLGKTLSVEVQTLFFPIIHNVCLEEII